MSDLIKLSLDGPIATLELNRPEKLNALNREMLDALIAALDRIETDPDLRVLVLTGAGPKSFCVGADILEWSQLPPLQMWKIWIREGHRIMGQISQLAIPVIASLNGFTLGGGLELALTADIRIAADHVMLGAPETKLGIIPGWGGTQRLKQVVGTARAKQMIFTGDSISADQAMAWNLVNEVVPAAELGRHTRALAETIAANAPVAVQASKALLDADGSSHDGPLLEGLAGALTSFTEDAKAGVAAFKTKSTVKVKFQGQ